MDVPIRCGKCENCIKIEKLRKSVLANCNPPFAHADDDVVQIWNDALLDWPCTRGEHHGPR